MAVVSGGLGVRDVVAVLAELHSSLVDVVPEVGGDDLVELERARSLLDAVNARLLAAFDASKEFRTDLSPSVVAWQRRHLRLDAGEAQRRLKTARLLRDLPDTPPRWARGASACATSRRWSGPCWASACRCCRRPSRCCSSSRPAPSLGRCGWPPAGCATWPTRARPRSSGPSG